MIRQRWWAVGFIVAGTAIAASTVDEEILKDLDFYSMLDSVEDVSLFEDADAAELETGDETNEQR